MTQRSKYKQDGLSFYDSGVHGAMWQDCPHPALLDFARGYSYQNDFHSWSEDEWTITVVSAGTGTSTVATTGVAGGQVRVNTAANDNDGGQAQLDSISFALPASGSVWFDARVELTEEVTQCDAFVGQLALESGMPVIFGILTTDTIEQAVERAGTKAGNKGADAAMAALEMIDLLGKL